MKSIFDAVKTASGTFCLSSFLFSTEHRGLMVGISFGVWIASVVISKIIEK